MDTFQTRHSHTASAYDLIPPDRDVPRASPRIVPTGDISDAEYVVLSPQRKVYPSSKTESYGVPNTAVRFIVFQSFGLLAFLFRMVEKHLQNASRRVFASFVIACAVLAFGLLGGFSGLSAQPTIPDTLTFSHVTLTPREVNGMPTLVLTGVIDNRTGRASEIPPIRAELVTDGQMVASVLVTPPSKQIDAAESRGFTTRVRYPGGKMPQVRLSFVPRDA